VKPVIFEIVQGEEDLASHSGLGLIGFCWGRRDWKSDWMRFLFRSIRSRKIQRRRLRSVMQDLIYRAVRLVRHARRIRLSFGRQNPWYGVWRRIYARFTQGGEGRVGWNSA